MKKLLLLFASLSILAILASCNSGESGSDSDATNAVAPYSIAGNTYTLKALPNPEKEHKGSLPSSSTIVFDKKNTFAIKSTSGDGTNLTGSYIYTKDPTETNIGLVIIITEVSTFEHGAIAFDFKDSIYAAAFDKNKNKDKDPSHIQTGTFK